MKVTRQEQKNRDAAKSYSESPEEKTVWRHIDEKLNVVVLLSALFRYHR